MVEQLLAPSLTPEQRTAFDAELKKANWREVATFVLDHGATATNNAEGYSPLYFATYMGDAGIAGAMIEHGADIDNSKARETVLHSAIAEHPAAV